MHTNEGEGQLASFKQEIIQKKILEKGRQCFTYPIAPAPSQFIYFPFLFDFITHIDPTSAPHGSYIDPASTLHQPHIDPSLTFPFITVYL